METGGGGGGGGGDWCLKSYQPVCLVPLIMCVVLLDSTWCLPWSWRSLWPRWLAGLSFLLCVWMCRLCGHASTQHDGVHHGAPQNQGGDERAQATAADGQESGDSRDPALSRGGECVSSTVFGS